MAMLLLVAFFWSAEAPMFCDIELKIEKDKLKQASCVRFMEIQSLSSNACKFWGPNNILF